MSKAKALARKRARLKAAALGRSMPSISRDAGRHRGTLSNYRPARTNVSLEAFERGTAQARSEDLTANDWAAASVVESMTVNTVGSGIKPQARVNWKRLGISREAAKDLNEQMEWAWKLWSVEAHVSGKLHFDDLVFLGMRSLLRMGELLHLPLWLKEPGRNFSLTFQDVHPGRLCTPADRKMDPNLRDGVELSPIGRPLAYWIASPTPSRGVGLTQPFSLLGSAHFVRRSAVHGHLPAVFHCFRAEEDEQVRGVPKFAPGMKLFRHLNDSFDYELMAQIVSASMPIFIATKDPHATARNLQPQPEEGEEDPRRYYQNLPPGMVAYGNPGEEPIPIESNRPGNNFASFAELIMRSMAASVGMPYEVLAKDFSKTNYSSARAALLEAWRIFMLYRTWLVRHYCQPIWNMVMEEAWLRGTITLPPGAPDFYDALPAYTHATWIGPARGYVDPVKEVVATTKALEARLTTYADAIAERGGDIEETWDTRAAEEERLREMDSKQQESANV